ncbi:methyl-accepting chemotaxis protein [Acerihabitans sp. TG2]|uniref:methyl-accepting chemotaxis protein n=1 Tax=Acerihabitans sp. TG2 TaxID=3096008 RepID=UPI002B2363CF|nr:methyl-accepting chemotaxis protein [Acerihabitans sp. TG2]MEA9390211.1 methyl-accepting chemotaxis protein [Acerihabitans sp. TG2]
MKNISVRLALTGAISIFVLMILAISCAGLFTLTRSNDTTEFVHQADSRVILINDVYKDSARTRAGFALVYASLLKNGKVDPWIFKNIETTHQRMLANIQRFKDLPVMLSSDEDIKTELVDSASALSQLINQAQQLLQVGDVKGYYDINIKDIDQAGGRFSKSLEKYQKNTRETVNTLTEQRNSEYRQLMWTMAMVLIITLAITITVLYVLRNTILRPLNYAIEQLNAVAKGDLTADIRVSSKSEMGKLLSAISGMQQSLMRLVRQVRFGVEEINIGSREIAAGNTDLSSRTEAQASSLEETASSMDELASTVKQNADNARQTSQLAANASQMAESGRKVVSDVVLTMNEISSSSSKISEIISVIDGIAFQTNILALNAAVEAARAGEQGKGFAVVASEVRSLAQRTASAAKEIKLLIENSTAKVNIGAEQVERAGVTMHEIVSSVKHVTDTVAEISAASQEQSCGIDQVNLAVSQMDAATQQNASLVEESSAASGSLMEQVRLLLETLQVFKLHEPAERPETVKPNTAKVSQSLANKPAEKPNDNAGWETF